MAYVIKVEYEGSLRRVLASPTEKNGLSLAKLEARVRDLFKIPSTTQLTMAYKDNENDVITVGNDQDLSDACVTQKINPLYIRVVIVTKAAEKQNSPVTPEALDVSSTQEPVKESVIPEKPTRKTVKIVDPVFQRILPPNSVPHMIEGIAKMMSSQMHVAKRVEAAPNSTQAKSNVATKEEKNSNPAEEKKTDGKSGCPDQRIHKGVSCSICQMNPIVGPVFYSVKIVSNHLCGSCYTKAGNATDDKRCKEPVTGRNCAGRTSLQSVRTSSALGVGPARIVVSPLIVFGPRGATAARCNQVKTC